MKNSFQKIPFLLSVAFLLLSSFAFIFVYGETVENNRVAEESIEEWKAELVRREEIKSLERTVKMFEAETLLVESHFAYESDVVPFLNTLESLARAAEADPEITSVDPSPQGDMLLVSMYAEGSFESLYKFLRLLENSPYELEFTSVDLSLPSDDTESGEWRLLLDFNLLTFVR